ncbi:DUF4232 domain-containing protein [Verrucosispora sioxanthis]|uniref:DUF4232 domain-containing protein n=1 Tax=Verrucosispora sioxanthis TaxID=2499994 RepID=A0A6M1L8Y6_9ACTN|nr:DUF4232 domain-containing protein [Verrucosispora sioxanthis]NEE65557.1 DUF4232 domain-containing protein [Verrucosispora sioxanthis]NGM14667.1 DUF4232 domain-containing protein [Verrucosispora sioxanthis]
MPRTTVRSSAPGGRRLSTVPISIAAAFGLLAGCAPAGDIVAAPPGPVPGSSGPGADSSGTTPPSDGGLGGPPSRDGDLGGSNGPTSECPDSGVRITYRGVSAAMGLRAMGLELVNCGDRPYRLRGYPEPSLRDADGRAIPVRVIRGAKGITSGFDDPPRSLVLAPGEAAGAALLWRNLVDNPTVVATNAEHLEVAPLRGRPAQQVIMQGRIDLGNTDRLGVSAWQKREPSTPEPTRAVPNPPPTTPAPLL